MRGNFYYRRLGKKISKIRKNRQLSLEQLALLSYVDRSYLNEVETGKANPSIKYLRKIIKILKIELDSLLKDV